ncbi:MAG: lysophospholipid acyltransferase family protein [Candidatus Omnitrophota bacterium]|nr:MAG: lysophospholipid acyltransferase family protein [Candidatus Omnitrophota bacterium]
MLFLLYRIGIFVALRISLEKAYSIAATVGRIYSFFSFRDRQAVCDNLKTIFPEINKGEISSMSREIFANFCKYLIDFFRFPLIDNDYIKKSVKIEGLENLDRSLAKKRGVILVSAHLGNWELGGGILSKLGYNLSAVVLRHRHKNVDDFFIQRRQILGMKAIPFGGALRRCFSILSENNILALVGDRDYFDNGVQIPFFKKKTIIPKGPAVLSLRFGSPIIPTFMARNADDTFTFKFYPPIEYALSGNKDRDIRFLTLNYLKVLEDVIREYPTQWYVFRRFWERIGWRL